MRPFVDVEGVGRFYSTKHFQIYLDLLWESTPKLRTNIQVFDGLVRSGFTYRQALRVDPRSHTFKLMLDALKYRELIAAGIA